MRKQTNYKQPGTGFMNAGMYVMSVGLIAMSYGFPSSIKKDNFIEDFKPTDQQSALYEKKWQETIAEKFPFIKPEFGQVYMNKEEFIRGLKEQHLENVITNYSPTDPVTYLIYKTKEETLVSPGIIAGLGGVCLILCGIIRSEKAKNKRRRK